MSPKRKKTETQSEPSLEVRRLRTMLKTAMKVLGYTNRDVERKLGLSGSGIPACYRHDMFDRLPEDHPVFGLAVSGTRLFMGGNFTSVNGVGRGRARGSPSPRPRGRRGS